MQPAFDGVRVLELGQIYNGPYCGLLFAQLGADVIKIEPPGGEQLRFRSHQPTESHEFVMLNSNKRSVVLDLKTDAGRQALLDLVKTADVLIENFAPGTMERLRLGAERLLEHNPRLVVACGKGYGSTGPYAHMSAMDITVQAMSGSASATGESDGPPTKAGAAFVDFSGGIHLFGAISAALFQRERTGRGQIVEVSMHDTIYPMLASSLGGLHNNPDRELPERTGNRHSGMAVTPYNIYQTSDGWLAIICISERHWRGVATALGRAELIDDPRFRTEKDRVANIDAVDDEVSSVNRWPDARRAGARPAGRRCALCAGQVDPRGRHRRAPDPARHDPLRRALGAGTGPRPGMPAAPERFAGRTVAGRPAAGPVDRGGPGGTVGRGECSMSFTPEPGTPLAAYYAQNQPRIGEVLSRRSLGTLDAVTIGRYAMTIGASDPSHYDPVAARSAGYADVVAPPNMLAAIVEWGVGTPEAQLQPDGTPLDGDMPLGGDLGLRVMGAGEEMELVNPVVAGTELMLEATLEAVTPKQTRSGTCVFVTTINTFTSADGAVLNRNKRTVVLRNPLQES